MMLFLVNSAALQAAADVPSTGKLLPLVRGSSVGPALQHNATILAVNKLQFEEQPGLSLYQEPGWPPLNPRNEGDGDENKVFNLRGTVTAAPQGSAGIGEWQIRTDDQKIWIFIADAQTRLDTPLPSVNQRVKARGRQQSDGTVLALHIRGDEYEANEVVVRLKPGVNPQSVAKPEGMDVVYSLLDSANIHLFRSTEKEDDDREENLLERLQKNESVIWAELNYVSSAPIADPYQVWKWGGLDSGSYTNQAAFDQIGLPPVQPFYKGDGVTVAILDTGVSLTHPKLQERLIPGRDLIDDDWEPADESGVASGHGTHIAGVITHIAPNSAILPLRVLDGDGRGNSFIIAYGIEWAVAQGADVINLSLGTPYDSEVLEEAIAFAAAQGVIVVAAAGNQAGDEFQYPAAYTTTIAVTAVDAQNAKADFANFNDWVDIAAPGVGITSTITSPDGDGYASWSGTSMATSFVSGVAALSRAQNMQAPNEAIRQKLIDGAVNIDEINPAYQGQIGRLLSAVNTLGAPSTVYIPLVER